MMKMTVVRSAFVEHHLISYLRQLVLLIVLSVRKCVTCYREKHILVPSLTSNGLHTGIVFCLSFPCIEPRVYTCGVFFCEERSSLS